jgi:hypothetical protein
VIVNSTKKMSRMGSTPHRAWVTVSILLCSSPAFAQSLQHSSTTLIFDSLPAPPGIVSSADQQKPEPRVSGNITGILVDRNGAAIVNAHVKLMREGQPSGVEVVSDEDGRFFITNVAPGPFVLTITMEGFAVQSFSGTLRSGENYSVPQIALTLATNVTEVRVELSQIEVAQEQMKDEEKQRLLGVFPNFYVTYVPNAAPLTSKQKFNLAWKETIDPVNYIVIGGVAGLQQAQNDFKGYGQGAQGYAKRYAASYGDFLIGTYIGSAILPSLLKQDPRYFYKGTGSVRSRIYYAIANSVICKGDNGHWQFNYSEIGGSLAAGGISNLYYPSSDRNGVALTFENTLIGIGESAAANLLQEFVFRKFTTHVPNYPSPNPSIP